MAVYLDSSALIKLIVDETETPALGRFVEEQPPPILSSEIAVVEVFRAARRHDAVPRTVELVESLAKIPIDEAILQAAAAVEPPSLSTLDALHLASALGHRKRLDAFVAYDARLVAAARAAGLHVESPG